MRFLLTKPTARRCILMLLFTLTMQLYGLTSSALGEETVPVKKPQIETAPDIPIQDESDASSKKENASWLSRNKWWVALGGILLGGAAVAAANGNDGGGDNDNGSSYRLDW